MERENTFALCREAEWKETFQYFCNLLESILLTTDQKNIRVREIQTKLVSNVGNIAETSNSERKHTKKKYFFLSEKQRSIGRRAKKNMLLTTYIFDSM